MRRRTVTYVHETSVLAMPVSKMVEIVEHHQQGHVMHDAAVYNPTIWVVEDNGDVVPAYPGIGVILTSGEPPVLPQGFTASRIEHPNDLRRAPVTTSTGNAKSTTEHLPCSRRFPTDFSRGFLDHPNRRLTWDLTVINSDCLNGCGY